VALAETEDVGGSAGALAGPGGGGGFIMPRSRNAPHATAVTEVLIFAVDGRIHSRTRPGTRNRRSPTTITGHETSHGGSRLPTDRCRDRVDAGGIGAGAVSRLRR
jgi:hypothetical protein